MPVKSTTAESAPADERVILARLLRDCEAETISPCFTDLREDLRRAGIQRRTADIMKIVDRIVAAGRVLRVGKDSRTRVFTSPKTGKMTLPRRYFIAERDNKPPSKPAPGNSYDAAMKLGPPRRIVGRPDSERPMPRLSPAANDHKFSLVGCSAELAVV